MLTQLLLESSRGTGRAIRFIVPSSLTHQLVGNKLDLPRTSPPAKGDLFNFAHTRLAGTAVNSWDPPTCRSVPNTGNDHFCSCPVAVYR